MARRSLFAGRGVSVAVFLVSYQTIAAVSGTAFAQPVDLACKYYDARCQGGLKSPLCSELQQRCEAATGKGANNRSGVVDAPGQSVLQKLQTMPDCGPDEELVMVPTCMCDASAGQGAPAAGDAECASCSSDGVRLACQKQP